MENPITKLLDKLENKIKYELAQRGAQVAINEMIALRPQNAEKGLIQALELTKVD